MYKINVLNVVSVWLIFFVVWQPIPGFCLEPEGILVVANRRMKGSVDLAHYYMDLRLIPSSNFLVLALVRAGDYKLDGWVENPCFPGFQGERHLLKKDQVLLVSHLDSPDTVTV